MKRLALLGVAFWALTVAASEAETPVVVELFTSQGCSSCPPADRLLTELAERDDVIALALHVDYWDYIGWKDNFADPIFTERQRAYARAFGERSVYTPQMVVGGSDRVVGAKSMKLAELIEKHAKAESRAAVELSRNGGTVTIRASARGTVRPGARIQLVTYLPEATVDIGKGENAGRRLTYSNVVRTWADVGNWDGRSDFRASAKVPEGTPVVVLVQEKDGGPILGAARLIR